MRGTTPTRQTPEEQRLATCARLYGEHPENAVAWAELCKAAVKFARTARGRKALAYVGPSGKPGGIRPRKNPRPPVTT